MYRTPVQSSNLASIGYDDSQTLEVEFNSGSVYQYFKVPQIVYNRLISANSHGSYFNQYVKEAGYSWIQVR